MNATNASTRGDVSLDSLVAGVVDEFRARQQRGEKPDIEEYAARHPDAAPLLRKVLATFQLLDESLPNTADATVSEAPLSGTLGDFRILREIGRGGMGIVYEAEQISLARRVALKVLPFAATLDPRQLQRFHNEARAAASLHHEHIVPVFAVGQERGIHFFAMQFIDGQSVADLIEEGRGQRGDGRGKQDTVDAAQSPASTQDSPLSSRPAPLPARPSFQRIAEWAIQAANALEHAHSLGIVHRDIKPGNLMIDAHGQLWIADFGLARRAADSDLTMTGDVLGTLRYMSPEQALAKHDLVDHRSDVYSLGATLYEMLTLQPAVDGGDRQEVLRQITQTDAQGLRRLDHGIPVDLETIVLKALAKEPALRYSSAKELAEDLRRFLAHEPIRARRPTLNQRLGKWGRRNRPAVFAATIAAFIVVAILGAAGGLWYQSERDRTARELDKFQTRQAQLTKDMTNLLDESESRRREIHANLASPTKACDLILSKIDDWHETVTRARAGWQSAKNLATSNDDVMSAELAWRLQQVYQELEEDEADLKIAKRLDEIWMAAVTRTDANWRSSDTAPQYERLFQELGCDWKTSQPAVIASKIKQMTLRYVLVGALDVRANLSKDDRAQCLEICRLTDPDNWRDQVRQEQIWHDRQALERLAREADPGIQPPIILNIVADRLADAGGDGSVLLRSALLHYPQDFWLHRNLGASMRNLDQRIGCFQAALAIRPKSAPVHNSLGTALILKNDLDGAMLHFRKALELNPKNIDAHMNLGRVLRDNKKDLDGAILHYRNAFHLAPLHIPIYLRLGEALCAKGEYLEALQFWKKILDMKVTVSQEVLSNIRRSATCAAVLAAHSKGKLSDKDRWAMRQQASQWLRADVLSWANLVQKKEPGVVSAAAAALQEWQVEADLASVREADNLIKLTDEARESWRTLWADVEQLRKQAEAMFHETRVAGNVSDKHREMTHEIKAQVGTTYVIDLESKAFDSLLRLHDSQGKMLAENDDILLGVIRNSRIIFIPTGDGIYRIVASAFQNAGTGPYTLTIREFVK